MSKLVTAGAAVWYNGYAIAGDLSDVALTLGQDPVEKTSLADTAHAFAGSGLTNYRFTHQGYIDPATNDIDAILRADLGGTTERIITAAIPGGTAGNIAYSIKGLMGEYQRGGSVGGMVAISGAFMGVGAPVIRGTLLLTAQKLANGNGTAYQLGAVGAAQHLYAAAHMIQIAGGGGKSVALKVQSDSAEAFDSAADKIAFSAFTAIGSQWATPVAGEITDTWWRINFALTDCTSFTAIVNVGIF